MSLGGVKMVNGLGFGLLLLEVFSRSGAANSRGCEPQATTRNEQVYQYPNGNCMPKAHDVRACENCKHDGS